MVIPGIRKIVTEGDSEKRICALIYNIICTLMPYIKEQLVFDRHENKKKNYLLFKSKYSHAVLKSTIFECVGKLEN